MEGYFAIFLNQMMDPFSTDFFDDYPPIKTQTLFLLSHVLYDHSLIGEAKSMNLFYGQMLTLTTRSRSRKLYLFILTPFYSGLNSLALSLFLKTKSNIKIWTPSCSHTRSQQTYVWFEFDSISNFKFLHCLINSLWISKE